MAHHMGQVTTELGELQTMNFEDHCKVTELVLGNRHEDVHRWLDFYWTRYKATKHWTHRHHLQAIKAQFGNHPDPSKYLVAYLHILCDWMSHAGHAFVPRTPEEIEPELAKCNVELVKAMLDACDKGEF